MSPCFCCSLLGMIRRKGVFEIWMCRKGIYIYCSSGAFLRELSRGVMTAMPRRCHSHVTPAAARTMTPVAASPLSSRTGLRTTGLSVLSNFREATQKLRPNDPASTSASTRDSRCSAYRKILGSMAKNTRLQTRD